MKPGKALVGTFRPGQGNVAPSRLGSIGKYTGRILLPTPPYYSQLYSVVWPSASEFIPHSCFRPLSSARTNFSSWVWPLSKPSSPASVFLIQIQTPPNSSSTFINHALHPCGASGLNWVYPPWICHAPSLKAPPTSQDSCLCSSRFHLSFF